ncbi:hypothetical protein P9Z71_11450 [Glaesserella parasuis]|uniref:hypothetical protein n=1 Tax=Glaesserella parasuis TaxID=738 RepID=UPI0003AC0291|nr:hypothetical protein [Glaesserella parasuis]ATW43344.1 hypothetical protein A2U20_05810 [Glaesserella parasuis D74]EQA10807.1 hypothetical protein HPSD74_0507 [Glaesserella parasuis D74]MDG6310814.1 hypothetical protein [Glaesserella parasuis]MDP0316692.1 hypothetical protein [Glaesserella parasuis]
MISEQDKQKIFNGAYGVSRKGYKCKFVGLINGAHSYTHMFVYFNTKGLIFNTEHLNEDFKYHTEFESPEDVVGLWEDKPEPFDLNKALNNEPVMTREGNKAYIKYCLPEEYKNGFPLGGYIINSKASINHYSWSLTGKAVEIECNHPQDIIGMWQDSEPESVKSIRNLPASLTKPQDGMYYLNECGVYPSAYGKEMDINIFNQRVYFASEQDGRDWFNAMKNHK